MGDGARPAGTEIAGDARARIAFAATFARAALVYWTAVFPRVSRHLARWNGAARRIPDPELRRLALEALAKRSNIEGAAAFAVLAPRAHRRRAGDAMCAFQAAYNYLDMLGEQPSPDPLADGRRLHEALLYALDTAAGPGEEGARTPDWYEHHPRHADGGYLAGLIGECCRAAASLPSFATVAPAARAAAARIVAFQSLNLSESQGDHSGLQHWAQSATPAGSGLQWWETAAAAGSSLGVYAQLALAADPSPSPSRVSALEQAYFPWIGGLHSLLDNLIDKHEDEAAGHRSLIEYYGPQRAAERLHWLSREAIRRAQALADGRRHVLILAAMVANYLSSEQARAPELAPAGEAVLDAIGPLARPTMLVFRLRKALGASPG
jgi:tetraprenyl-beta-curcumene synthase